MGALGIQALARRARMGLLLARLPASPTHWADPQGKQGEPPVAHGEIFPAMLALG
jgi:hypothetical protein